MHVNKTKEIILRKLKGSSQKGSNEKLKIMFEILKIKIGEIEEHAIRVRNKMDHSSCWWRRIRRNKGYYKANSCISNSFP